MSNAVRKYPKTHYDFIRTEKEQYPDIDNHLRLAKTMVASGGDDKGDDKLASAVADWMTTTFIKGPWDDVARTEIFSMMRYESYGKQVFALNPIIQEMFDNTDVSRVGEVELSKLPYPCFYINLLGSKLEMSSFDGNSYAVSGFYVLRDNTDPDVPALTFFLHAEGPNGTFGSKFYFSLALKRCFERFTSVGDYIKYVVNDPKRDSSSPGIERTTKEQKETGKMFMHIYRIFAAFLMYLNTEDPSLREAVTNLGRRELLEKKVRRCKSAKKRKKYVTQLSRLQSSQKVTYVGEREEKRILEQCDGEYEVERHWRRGHDHKFWHGPLKDKVTGEDWSKVPDGVSAESFWEGRRNLITQWLEPRLIRSDKDEAEDRPSEHVYSLAVPASYLEKRQILDDMYSAMEGKAETVTLTRHERSRKNQQACFSYWGFECRICGFDPVKDHPLGEMVGELPSHGLEAHHLTPLGETDEEQKVSAIDDMRPLCNVCHKVVHARGTKHPPRDVEKMRKMVLEEVIRKSVGILKSEESTPDPVPEPSP